MANCLIKRRLKSYKGLTVGDFTYTGASQFIQDSAENSRVKFTGSGTFTPIKTLVVDIFLVGGGGNSGASAGGGGGGYTATYKKVKLRKGQSYSIIIGAGATNRPYGNLTGGTTSAFGLQALGGRGGNQSNSNGASDGGSGGGYYRTPTASYYNIRNGDGGSNGENGGTSNGFNAQPKNGGKGQNRTTREFGEATGDLYSPGGGAAENSIVVDNNTTRWLYTGTSGAGLNGNNSGAGGQHTTRNGRSGIVVIRNAREV